MEPDRSDLLLVVGKLELPEEVGRFGFEQLGRLKVAGNKGRLGELRRR